MATTIAQRPGVTTARRCASLRPRDRPRERDAGPATRRINPTQGMRARRSRASAGKPTGRGVVTGGHGVAALPDRRPGRSPCRGVTGIEVVPEGEPWMPPEQLRAGVAQDGPAPQLLRWGIAAERARGARGLLGAEHTMLHPRCDVALQARTSGTQLRTSTVPVTAVDAEQRRHDAALTFKTEFHGGHYRTTSSRYKGEPVSCCGRGMGRSSASRTSPQANGGWKTATPGCA